MQDHSILNAHVGSKNLGLEELAYSGFEFPPGFKDWIGTVGPLATVFK